MKVLLLWSPLADYTVACFRELAQKDSLSLHLIYQASESDAPYKEFDLGFCAYSEVFRKSKKEALLNYCMSLSPDIIIMASWNYRFYMNISKQCKRKGTFVISTFDNQWMGTMKQRLGVLTSSIYLKPSISNFFVAGDRQAQFSRKLGYKNPLQGYYTANTSRFLEVKYKKQLFRKFIFVGRLVSDKGIQDLVNAYNNYRRFVKNPWGLIVCGKGDLASLFENIEGVEMNGFVQPDELPSKLTEASCLLLPSYFEPWGLVIHEATLAGLTVICSHHCGAATYFVRDGQNGYIVNPDDKSLLNAMKLISGATYDRLEQMSANSRILSQLWTTDKWAEYIYNYIKDRSALAV